MKGRTNGAATAASNVAVAPLLVCAVVRCRRAPQLAVVVEGGTSFVRFLLVHEREVARGSTRVAGLQQRK